MVLDLGLMVYRSIIFDVNICVLSSCSSSSSSLVLLTRTLCSGRLVLTNLIKNLTKEDVNDRNNIHQLRDGDKIVNNKQDMCELVNTFFINQQRKILSSILTSASVVLSQRNILSSDNDQFKIPCITTDQIKKLLQSMPCHKATGLDGIGARVLTLAASSR